MCGCHGSFVQSEVVLREKLRSSEVEIKALRDQVALLTESLGVQKKLLAAKNEEKEEVEYQWGEAKGRLAMREADYGQLEVSEVVSWACIAQSCLRVNFVLVCCVIFPCSVQFL